MPKPAWQARRDALRPARPKAPQIPAAALCVPCGHVHSSHSLLTVAGPCKVAECGCQHFEPMCGCGHLLASHTWGTPPVPWGCYQCACKGFGAQAQEQLRIFL